MRRDNIGDLVCTTPLFAALRRAFPAAFIAALVNSYNHEILKRNPNIDRVFCYTKAKHRERVALANIYWQRWKLLQALRRARFSHVVVAGTTTVDVMRAIQYARPGCIVRHPDGAPLRARQLAVAPAAGMHEVARTLELLQPLGIDTDNVLPAIYPAPEIIRTLGAALRVPTGTSGPLIAVHISARKPSQRWPTIRFATLIQALRSRHDARFVILWSPGRAGDKRHPGDDQKASELKALLMDMPAVFLPTPSLAELVAALALCDSVICSDGGAMHIAAALRKPIVCLFGNSNAQRWHPFGTPHRILQPASLNVGDITTTEVLSAYEELAHQTRCG